MTRDNFRILIRTALPSGPESRESLSRGWRTLRIVVPAVTGIVAVFAVIHFLTGWNAASWYLQTQLAGGSAAKWSAIALSIVIGTTGRIVGIYLVPERKAIYKLSWQVAVGSFAIEIVQRIIHGYLTRTVFDGIDPITSASTRALVSLVFGLTMSCVYDFTFTQWQGFLKIRALRKRLGHGGDGLIELEIQRTREGLRWDPVTHNISGGVISRASSSFLQHNLSQNWADVAHRILLLFTVGFANNVYATGMVNRKHKVAVHPLRVFGVGLLLVPISAWWVPGTEISALLVTVLATWHFLNKWDPPTQPTLAST